MNIIKMIAAWFAWLTPAFGSDSSSPPPANVTNTQSNLPDYAAPYFTSLMDRATEQSTTPYPNYPGQMVADLSPLQNQAFSMGQDIATNQPGQFDAGTNLASSAGLGALNTANTAPGMIMDAYNPANVQNWMNPYQQGVTDIAKDQANTQFAQQQNAFRANEAAHGALGGYRDAIQQAQNQKDQNILLNNIQTQGSQQAYNAALQAMGGQAQAIGGAAQTALTGYGQAGQQAATLGSLGTQQLAGQQAGLTDLQQLGATQQQQQQNQLTTAFNQYMNAADYPRQQLNFLSGILHGVPVTPSSNVTQFTAPPSPYSQLLGLGIGAAGLSKLAGSGSTSQ